MRSLLLLLLAGCNEFYGLDPTTLITDEVDGCPELGTTVPEYSPLLRVIIPRNCFNFTLDEQGRSAAVCSVRDGENVIETGDANELAPAQITRTVGATFEDPALTPEGDHLFVRQFGPTLAVNTWSMFRRDGARWTFERDLISSPNEFGTLGVPSRGPDRRAIFSTLGGGLQELAEDMSWAPIRTQQWSELGVVIGTQPNLSPDGLRLVFLADRRMYYAERKSKADPFGVGRVMSSLPEDISSTVFMTAGCSRIYYTGFGNVFYQSQRR